MATPVGRIEREFFLRAMFNEKIPVRYIKDRIEYIFYLEQPAGEELVFRPNRQMVKLKPHSRLPFLFNYRGQVIDFNVEILAQKNDLIYCRTPEAFHKNLDRNYLRVNTPSDIKIIFTFEGDRYNLSFPKINEYENITGEDVVHQLDTSSLSSLMKQIIGSLSNFADGFKIVNFKDKNLDVMEEHIVAETGKTLFVPLTSGTLPRTDPYPKKRIITEELFKRYLESTGVEKISLRENCRRFLRKKNNDGILSDAWVPILFHEYVIGYIHIWNTNPSRAPFDFNILDTVYQYAKVLAFALKENGYFEYGRVSNEPFEGMVLDISASGLLFAYPLGTTFSATLLIDTELTVIIEAPARTINVIARIVRRFEDRTMGYFGCRFINIAPEDIRFLFEHLYGRQLEDKDAGFLSGQV